MVCVIGMLLSFIPVIGRLLPLLVSPLYFVGILLVAFAKLDLGATGKKLTDELSAGEVMPFLHVLIAGLIGGIGIILCGVGVVLTYPLGICAIVYGFIRAYGDEIKEGDKGGDIPPPPAPPASQDDPPAPTQP